MILATVENTGIQMICCKKNMNQIEVKWQQTYNRMTEKTTTYLQPNQEVNHKHTQMKTSALW